MKRIIIVLLTVLMIPLLFIGCAQSAAKQKGEFIIVNGAEPETLDPQLITGVPEHRIYFSLFEGLVTTDPKTATAVPGLAKSWEVSDDGTVYTFKLRKTTWTDGVKITAQTVVGSWLRMLDPKTASPYAWFPAMFIKGANEYNGEESGPEAVKIRALDDYTFEMELVGPLPYVLDALAHYSFAVVPLHAIEKYGTEWTNVENFVGNGPFKLEEWEPQEKLSCVPNEKYWDKKAVRLERVTYLPVDDNNTAYNMFLSNEADWATQIPLDMIDSAKLRDDYQNAPYLGTYYYVLQNEKPVFDNVLVRKALSMSLNREKLVNEVTKGGEFPTFKMVPDMTGYPSIDGTGYDVEKAKELLAEAGYPDGEGFPKFTILYNTNEAHKKIAEFIQQEWKENLGIDCDLENQEWKTYLATARAGDFQVERAGWIGDYQDPNTFLDMFVTGGAMNGGRYSNPEYDELIEKASRMEPGEERFKTLQKAERLFIEEDQGVIPIYHYTTKQAIDTSKWGDWYTNVMDWHPTKGIYKK